MFRRHLACWLFSAARCGLERRLRGSVGDDEDTSCTARRALLRGVSFALPFVGRRVGVRRSLSTACGGAALLALTLARRDARLDALRARLPTLRSS